MHALAAALLAAVAWTPINAALTQIAPPSVEDAHGARFGTRAWAVRFEGERLFVAPATTAKPHLPFAPEIDIAHLGYYGSQPTQALRVGNDWFLSYNFGEFGGGLWLFDAKGITGRRLLVDPVYGLRRYGAGVLAETPDNSMMVRRVRVHRFEQRNGSWQEIGHTDFSQNISQLTSVGASLYTVIPEFRGTALAKVDLEGHVAVLWRYGRDLTVRTIARSASGDFALGSTGYVVRLHPTGSGFVESWYAPRDCVAYSNVEQDDGIFARCVGMRGVAGYVKRSLAPIRNPLVTLSGEWMLSRYRPVQLLHFTNSTWTQAAAPNLSETEFPQELEQAGSVLALRTNQHVWLRESGRWRVLPTPGAACSLPYAFTVSSVWAMECGDSPRISRTGFDGTNETWNLRRPSELVAAGLADDIWFSEHDASFLGHLDARQGVVELTTSSPVATISRGSDRVWFTETDKAHYGFIDTKNGMHEFKESSQYIEVLSVRGTPAGAWIRESLGGRMIVYHADDSPPNANNVADIQKEAVSTDGSVWALSSNWLTVVHVTENGEMTRYRLPCLDAHALFFPAPNNGLWVQSYEPHCNVLIDSGGLHERDLPPVEQIDYN